MNLLCISVALALLLALSDPSILAALCVSAASPVAFALSSAWAVLRVSNLGDFLVALMDMLVRWSVGRSVGMYDVP
jgi:hypothetical protein